ncbi:MAG: discoidin domain-containing protein, partial [Bacteroidota bacterium]
NNAYFTLAIPQLKAPGNIATNLELWFRADSAVTVSSLFWLDQTDNMVEVSETVEANTPTYITSEPGLINCNPVISFDGGDNLENSTFSTNDLTGDGTGDFSVFAVSQSPNAGASDIIISFNGTTYLTTNNGRSEFRTDNTVHQSTTVDLIDNQPHLQSVSKSGIAAGDIEMWNDGEMLTLSNDNPDDNIANRVGIGIGSTSNTSASAGFDGSIAEIIAYADSLTPTQRQQVETYLAVKYGIDLPHNQYLSGAAASIYNEGATYDSDNAGIGRSDDMGLNQFKTRSIEPTAILKVTAETDLDDEEYLIWGHDGDAPEVFTATNAPDGLQISNRVWAASETGQTGTLTLEFDATTFDGFNAPHLVIDTDNDGSFTDETPILMTLNSSVYTATGINIEDGNLFTVGTCGLIDAGLTNVQCNDNMTPTDDSDDYITFDLNPQNANGTYTVTAETNTVTPSTGTYGAVTNFRLQDGSAGDGNITLTITDNTLGTCTKDTIIVDPGTCVPDCDVSISNVVIDCSNDGLSYTLNFDVSWDYINASTTPIEVIVDGMAQADITPAAATGTQSVTGIALSGPAFGKTIAVQFEDFNACSDTEVFDLIPNTSCVPSCGVTSCASNTLLDPDPASPDYVNSGNFNASLNAPQLTSTTSWSGVNNTSTTQFIGMLFSAPSGIVGVTTKGRGDAAQWVTSYQLEGTKDGTTWISLGTYTANTDQNTEVFNSVANTDEDWTGLRINPQTWNGFPSLRFQFSLGTSCVSQSLGGNVFSDGNQNGVMDIDESGQGNILVEIYQCDATMPTTSVYTNVEGGWSIDDAGLTYPVRVEFSSPLKPELQASIQGMDNGTNVQFVNEASCDIDFAVIDPNEFCSS